MLKLLKYEMKKSYSLKLAVCLITVLVEAVYLYGLFYDRENIIALGIAGLCLSALIGTIVIGLASIMILWRELNTKESYMLFMTPKTSYEILGAKVVESAIAIICTSVLFGVLAYLDLQLLARYSDTNVSYFFSALGFTRLKPMELFAIVSLMASEFLQFFATAYLAVILVSTVFNGKKYGGWISFGLYIFINSAVVYLANSIRPSAGNPYLQMGVECGMAIGFTVIFYLIACWIMDRKLSV